MSISQINHSQGVLKLVIALMLFYSVSAIGKEHNYVKSEVEMVLKKVSEHVYYAQGKAGIATDNEGFISNASVIITDKGVVLVDALGTPSLAVSLLEKLRTLTDKPVVKVIVTHYHADHIYGLQVFKELGAEIIAPAGYEGYYDAPIAKERLEERRDSLYPWVDEKTYLVKPDVVVDKNTTLKVGDVELEIHYLGSAHSTGDLSVLVKNDAVLISGDIIFEGRVPFTGGANTKNWLEVLEQLDKNNVKALIPGHGPAAKKPAEAVKLTYHYLKKVRETMMEAVEELMPFEEAYDNADWSEFEHLPAFKAAHRRNVYGVFLSLEADSVGE